MNKDQIKTKTAKLNNNSHSKQKSKTRTTVDGVRVCDVVPLTGLEPV
jgi:hypothetical protein